MSKTILATGDILTVEREGYIPLKIVVNIHQFGRGGVSAWFAVPKDCCNLVSTVTGKWDSVFTMHMKEEEHETEE